jgi:acyl-CoA synthetase (AMP-forming)/AMP-acid ligase II
MSPTAACQQVQQALAQLTGPGAPFELATGEVDGVSQLLFRHAPATLVDYIDGGRRHGDKVFVVYQGERWTFAQLFALADAVGHQLVHAAGVRPGQRVALAMRNYPEWMAAFIAIVSVGAVAVPLNSWGRAQELEHGLADAGAQLVFCDHERAGLIAAVLPGLGIRGVVARSNGALPPALERWEHFVGGGSGRPMPAFRADADAPALIMYTSGTTGKAKGAVSSHRNIVQALLNFECWGAVCATAFPAALAAQAANGFEPTALLAVPLFHVSGCHVVFLQSLRAGRKVVMLYKWEVERALQLIEQERVTALAGVPAMTYELLLAPGFDRYDTRSLISVGGGGSAAPALMHALIRRKIDNPFAGVGYGLTESNACGTSSTADLYDASPFSAGLPAPIMEIRVVDEQERELPRGQAGAIWLRGPTLARGYWNQPEATAETFRDGWLRTGDIGYIDQHGLLWVVDRAKDMVIRGGENIASAEIEAALYEHADVLEAAAFGVPHEVLGEELAVVVFAGGDCALDADAIRAHLGARLARFKVPAQVEIAAEPLPRSPSGKILKRELRGAMLQRLGLA